MTVPAQRQSGFTFLWLLFLIVGLGVSMAALGTMWHSVVQREKEAELLFIGDQYRKAIEHFSQTVAPDGQKRLPKMLEELLQDPRFPNIVRHLRRAYRDPMTGKAEWGLVKGAEGGISGVYSLSEAKPIKSAGFSVGLVGFENAERYRDWLFNITAGSTTASSGNADPASDSKRQEPRASQDRQSQQEQIEQSEQRIQACKAQHDSANAGCVYKSTDDGLRTYWAYQECLRKANEQNSKCLVAKP